MKIQQNTSQYTAFQAVGVRQSGKSLAPEEVAELLHGLRSRVVNLRAQNVTGDNTPKLGRSQNRVTLDFGEDQITLSESHGAMAESTCEIEMAKNSGETTTIRKEFNSSPTDGLFDFVQKAIHRIWQGWALE